MVEEDIYTEKALYHAQRKIDLKGSKAIIRIKEKPDSAYEESHMAELTIQISDELAQRLEPLQNRLPELLWQLLDVANLPTNSQPRIKTETTDIPAVYQEVLDFLIKRPTPEEIIAFKVSPQAQTWLSELLEKNRSATLRPMELAELDVYEQLEHMMILLKARALKRD